MTSYWNCAALCAYIRDTMKDEMELPARLAPKEVAAHLGVAAFTLWCWRKRKAGPPYYRQVGRIWYDRGLLLAWQRQNSEMCELRGTE